MSASSVMRRSLTLSLWEREGVRVLQGEGAPNHAKPRSHDTSRIAWAKLLARVGEEFPVDCPACGGDIRLRIDGRREPALFEPEVRKRAKARMASHA
jgi:hypothetical protein